MGNKTKHIYSLAETNRSSFLFRINSTSDFQSSGLILFRREELASDRHLHTQHSFGVTVQRAQQKATLGVSYADGAVIGADQQHPAGALLCRSQTAHPPRAVALKHIQLLHSLARQGGGG